MPRSGHRELGDEKGVAIDCVVHVQPSNFPHGRIYGESGSLATEARLTYSVLDLDGVFLSTTPISQCIEQALCQLWFAKVLKIQVKSLLQLNSLTHQLTKSGVIAGLGADFQKRCTIVTLSRIAPID